MSDMRRAAMLHIVAQVRAGFLVLLMRRMRAGQTIDQIAERLGWKAEQVWAVVDGPKMPSLHDIAELAWALDAEVSISLEAAHP